MKFSNALLAVCITILFTTTTRAQMGQFMYGYTGTNTITNDSRFIPSTGGMVHVGYLYDPQGPVAPYPEGEALIFTTTSAGALVWQHTLKGLHDCQFKQVKVAANGDYIAVGYTSRAHSGPVFGQNEQHRAMIARFSSAGTLLWYRELLDNNPNSGSYGDVYFGVHEMPDGHIVAVGTTDYRPGGVSDAEMTYFDAGGSQMWSKKFMRSNSDHFFGVTNYNDEILACGITDQYASDYSGILTRVDVNGNHIATYKYDYTYFQPTYGNYKTVWFNEVINRGGNITVNGAISNDRGVTTGNIHLVLDIDGSFNATGRIIDDAPFNYTGNSKMFPMGVDDYIVVEDPGNTVYNPTGGNTLNDFYVGRITGGIATYMNRITGSPKSINGLDVNGTNIYLGGSIQQSATGMGAINSLDVVTSMSMTSDAQCAFEHVDVNIYPVSITPTDWNWDLADGPFDDDENLAYQSPVMIDSNICGSYPPGGGSDCDLQCYWRTTGNNAITSANFIGPINASELRFRTVNVERGLFDQDGDFGINLGGGLPTAKLHVDCASPTQGPSNLRFEHLPTPKDKLPILVIDANGYVYQTKNDIASRSAGGDDQIKKLEEKLEALQQQVTTLQNMLGQRTDFSSTDAVKIFPNPTEGDITVSYNLPNLKQPAEVVLTDVAGQRVLSQTLTAVSGDVKMTIPGNIVSGTLYCNVMSEGKVIATRKITLNRK